MMRLLWRCIINIDPEEFIDILTEVMSDQMHDNFIPHSWIDGEDWIIDGQVPLHIVKDALDQYYNKMKSGGIDHRRDFHNGH